MAPRQRAKNSAEKDQKPLYIIGVVSDTHIPDRVGALHPLILPSLRAEGVTHIFHAGDICSVSVLAVLEEIAPVTAVRGNRDWFVRGLPLVSEMELGGVHIALMHGHGGIIPYLFNKAHFILSGYNKKRYEKSVTRTAPDAQVLVYGHTHVPETIWLQEKLLFNPGSASFGAKEEYVPSIGYLRIFENGRVKPSTQYLKGYNIIKRRWVKHAPAFDS